jgi:hypothetical protein
VGGANRRSLWPDIAGRKGAGESAGGPAGKIPGVTKVEWKLNSDKNYEAEFELKDVEVTAKFDDNGKWLETETAIEQSALTKEVLATISKGYKGYEIIETQKVERADNKSMLFEVHLENAEEILKVQLEANGPVASRTTKRKKDQ